MIHLVILSELPLGMETIKQTIVVLMVFVFLIVFCEGATVCPKCGNDTVPYPLSTGNGCGDPDYKVVCSNNQLELPALNGSSYRILSINPGSMRMVLKPSDLRNDSCQTEDMKADGLQLNPSLPFNITSTNTVMLLNCNSVLLRSPLNCSSNSPCHEFIDQVGTAMPCRNTSLCCTFTAGGSSTMHRIRVWRGGCRAYTSVLNFDAGLPPSRWNYGVEIMWAAPSEPYCTSQGNCDKNSSCLKDPMDSAKSRCFCANDYVWNPVQGVCAKNLSLCLDPDGCGGSDHRGPVIAGLVAGLSITILIGFLAIVFYRRKKLQRQIRARLAKERADILALNSGGKAARLFTGREMNKATNGFSKDRLLGTGGFGEVFKGTLKDGTVVAVKAAKVGNIKATEQVLNEVRILSQVNHRNLVRLLGCCVDIQQPLMVYEYIPNGTLFDHLHTTRGIFLDWKKRLSIAFQTSEALAYLHSAAFPPIYHRDVKSTNILLDDKLNAKVSDFGLSRLAETDLSHISTCAQGTLGYLDPEYYRNYQLTDKSDVYSFGIVLLELVTSQKAIDFTREMDLVNLAVYVAHYVEEGKLMDVVDGRLAAGASDEEMKSVEGIAMLAMACLHERRQERPAMKEVAEEIQYIIGIAAAGIGLVENDVRGNEESGLLLGRRQRQ